MEVVEIPTIYVEDVAKEEYEISHIVLHDDSRTDRYYW
jgi:hypothetical protein